MARRGRRDDDIPMLTDTFSLMGTTVRPVASAPAYELIESTIEPGGGSPPHTLDYDKDFYVLDGEITLFVEGEARTARAGDATHVPAGAVHNYENRSGAPARMLVLTGGAEHIAFLRGLSALVAGGVPDAAAVAAHAGRHGVRMLPRT